jgi:hypothetical protein
MSFAIALENSPETISYIKTTLGILKSLRDGDVPPGADEGSYVDELDPLIDWYEDLHKILTDYTMFAEDSSAERQLDTSS